MIPPLLLDIKPDNIVLDACASPGSKTMQIIELMHKGFANQDGLVVANDVENKRCYLLVHQALKRMPTVNCVVVNHDASKLPLIHDEKNQPIYFDRILCDVVCSGDGTLRKNPQIWKHWSPHRAISLHRLQYKIARRCVEILSINGLMCYSTCSLNPIEDEAVVAALLRRFRGSIELVDVKSKMPQLNSSPGITNWRVFGKEMREFKPNDGTDKDRFQITESMFPPTSTETEWMHLDRAFRILPHKHNTGGFFIAIFRKTAENEQKDVQDESSIADGDLERKNDADNKISTHRPKKQRRKDKSYMENPFVFFEGDDLQNISDQLERHYGIDPKEFPVENLLVRTESDNRRSIYFVNTRLREFLKYNAHRYHLVNAGTSIFRNDKKVSNCTYRLKQDGLRIVSPYIKRCKVDISSADMRRILSLTKDQQFIRKEQLDDCNAFSIFDSGSVVLRHITTDGFCKEICAWVGAETINPFVCREEKLHILSMISNEPLPKHMCRSVIMDLLKKPPREKEDDNQIASA